MKFYSRELSQKLQDMGCISQSMCAWDGDQIIFVYRDDPCPKKGLIPTFSYFDFCGPSEQCHKNAQIVFGTQNLIDCPFCEQQTGGDGDIYSWKYHRHIMIDLPEEEQEAFMLQ